MCRSGFSVTGCFPSGKDDDADGHRAQSEDFEDDGEWAVGGFLVEGVGADGDSDHGVGESQRGQAGRKRGPAVGVLTEKQPPRPRAMTR